MTPGSPGSPPPPSPNPSLSDGSPSDGSLWERSLSERLADAVHSDGAPSARNLLVTVFGDAVLLAGAETEVSVGALHALLVDFGVNERLVRTSLSRLVGDGLVESRSVGRRSLYRIAPHAIPTFDDATERIYGARTMAWDGEWTIVVVDAGEGEADDRQQLRSALGSIGFTSAAPNVLVSAVHDPAAVERIAPRSGSARAIVTRSHLRSGGGMVDDRTLASASLGLDELAARYRAFVDDLSGFDVADVASLSPAQAWKLRLLAVASFRRIALIDPGAPARLLPVDWPGFAARRLVGSIYRRVASLADEHVAAVAGIDLRTDPDRFEVPDSPS